MPSSYQVDEDFRMAERTATVAGHGSPVTHHNRILVDEIYSKVGVHLKINM